MTHTSETVVLAVEPRLFCDTLADVLTRSGLVVEIHLPEAQAEGAGVVRRFRVAVVTGTLPADLEAEVVISMNEHGRRRCDHQESGESGESGQEEAFVDLESLIALIRATIAGSP